MWRSTVSGPGTPASGASAGVATGCRPAARRVVRLPDDTHLSRARFEQPQTWVARRRDRERRDVVPRAWSAKRERQLTHIKQGLEHRGRSEDTAEEIAARTVNKERAQAGEAKTSSRSSTHDMSSGRRGGLRSHRGPGGRTREQLYNEAKKKGVKGRSKMNKAQLQRAVDR